MNVPPKVRIGLVGAGVIAQVHAQAIAEQTNAELVAVAELQPESGKTFAERHRIDHVASIDELLAWQDIDAVALCTPSGLHAEQAVLAAEAGKHVITEKPMAITVDDADRMIAACNEAGVALAVIFQQRFSRDVRLVKRAIEFDVFGQIVLTTATVPWHRTPEYFAQSGGWRGTWELDGGGALMNQAIHTVDLVQWLVGPVTSVWGQVETLVHPIEAEDTAAATFTLESGGLANLTATTAADRDWPVTITIQGTKGRATLQNGVLARGEADLPADLLTEEDRHLTEGWEPDESFGAGHSRQYRAILRALSCGQQPPIPGPEGRNAIALIRAIYDSSSKRKPVDLT